MSLFSGNNSNGHKQIDNFLVGDVFYTRSDGTCNLYKLLVIDPDFECYHVLTYVPLDSLPTSDSIQNTPIFVYHSPFDKHAFTDTNLLMNKPVLANELIGYHEYLRQTQTPEQYIAIANNYYTSGLRLTDEKKLDEAIDAYTKAIDLFPPFFEAIDNRAFCKMDIGLWIDAIEDFKRSLIQNPNSLLAEFSIGECYFNMGDYEHAKRHFEIAYDIDPNHPAPKKLLDKVNEILAK